MTDLDCVILETKQTAVWYTTVGYWMLDNN
jgi:hypothetical protein